MIVLDTTVLVYAVGDDHALREPARSLVQAVEEGTVQATTSVEAIQEFVHVRARRATGRTPLRSAARTRLSSAPCSSRPRTTWRKGCDCSSERNGSALSMPSSPRRAITAKADALISADTAFDGIRGLRWADLADPGIESLIR